MNHNRVEFLVSGFSWQGGVELFKLFSKGFFDCPRDMRGLNEFSGKELGYDRTRIHKNPLSRAWVLVNIYSRVSDLANLTLSVTFNVSQFALAL